MNDRTRKDGVIFLPAFHANFFCQKVKTWKKRTIYVWPLYADIINSKEHETAVVIVYFPLLVKTVEEIFPLNSKCEFSLVLLKQKK